MATEKFSATAFEPERGSNERQTQTQIAAEPEVSSEKREQLATDLKLAEETDAAQLEAARGKLAEISDSPADLLIAEFAGSPISGAAFQRLSDPEKSPITQRMVDVVGRIKAASLEDLATFETFAQAVSEGRTVFVREWGKGLITSMIGTRRRELAASKPQTTTQEQVRPEKDNDFKHLQAERKRFNQLYPDTAGWSDEELYAAFVLCRKLVLSVEQIETIPRLEKIVVPQIQAANLPTRLKAHLLTTLVAQRRSDLQRARNTVFPDKWIIFNNPQETGNTVYDTINAK